MRRSDTCSWCVRKPTRARCVERAAVRERRPTSRCTWSGQRDPQPPSFGRGALRRRQGEDAQPLGPRAARPARGAGGADRRSGRRAARATTCSPTKTSRRRSNRHAEDPERGTGFGVFGDGLFDTAQPGVAPECVAADAAERRKADQRGKARRRASRQTERARRGRTATAPRHGTSCVRPNATRPRSNDGWRSSRKARHAGDVRVGRRLRCGGVVDDPEHVFASDASRREVSPFAMRCIRRASLRRPP